MDESVIDFPKDGLCPEIWEKVVDSTGLHEVWQLKLEVESKVLAFISKLLQEAALQSQTYEARITGSITSNTYTENADIDIHIVGLQADEPAEETQRRIASAMKKLKLEDYELVHVGKHPFEVYVQPNPFQDLMSIGCYDVLKRKWLVGPELKDLSYNPYEELYAEVKAASEDLAAQVRNRIFSAYETAIAVKKNIGTSFGGNVIQMLKTQLASMQELYDKMRAVRKHYSSPASREEALKFRQSKKWKIADAAFKLFDKYGYIAIIKQLIEDGKILIASDNVAEEVADDILSTVKKYISNADKLSEEEMYSEKAVDESAKSAVTASLLAAFLAIPGLLPAKTAYDAVSKHKKYSAVMQTLNKGSKMVGDFTEVQAANIIARTLYAEARGDGVENGYKPVASVIYNRADGKVENFAKACLKKWQFSCWNGLSDDEKTGKGFKVKIPDSVRKSNANRLLWQQAARIAADMMTGKFKPTTTANSYYATSMKNAPSWGKDLTQTKVIGGHKFGYLKKHAKFI